MNKYIGEMRTALEAKRKPGRQKEIKEIFGKLVAEDKMADIRLAIVAFSALIVGCVAGYLMG